MNCVLYVSLQVIKSLNYRGHWLFVPTNMDVNCCLLRSIKGIYIHSQSKDPFLVFCGWRENFHQLTGTDKDLWQRLWIRSLKQLDSNVTDVTEGIWEREGSKRESVLLTQCFSFPLLIFLPFTGVVACVPRASKGSTVTMATANTGPNRLPRGNSDWVTDHSSDCFLGQRSLGRKEQG